MKFAVQLSFVTLVYIVAGTKCNDRNSHIIVPYTLWIQSPPKILATVKFRIKNGSSLYDVMNHAAEQYPIYKFKTNEYPYGHYITKIDDYDRDDKRKLYWYVYNITSKPNISNPPGPDQLMPEGVTIDRLMVRENSYYLLWYQTLDSRYMYKDVENVEKDTFKIPYTLWEGNPPELVASINIWVKKNSTFYEVMQLAAEKNPVYKFRSTLVNKGHYITKIGDLNSNIVEKMFWRIYINQKKPDISDPPLPDEVMPNGFVVDNLIVKEGHYYLFWYRAWAPFTSISFSNIRQIKVPYILWVGNPPVTLATLDVWIRKNSTFYEVMQLAANMNPLYKFENIEFDNGHAITKIGQYTRDLVQNIYWFIYDMTSMPNILKPPDKDQLVPNGIFVDDLIVEENHYYLFWYRADAVIESNDKPKTKQIKVPYVLWVGNPPVTLATVDIWIDRNSTFYEVMQLAANTNPVYKFESTNYTGGHSISKIGQYSRNSNHKLYWFIYNMTSKPNILKPPKNDQLVPNGIYVNDLIVEEDRYYLFWYRTITITTSNVSSRKEEIKVSYFLWIENPPRTLGEVDVFVEQGSSFYDVMKIAANLNPTFKFAAIDQVKGHLITTISNYSRSYVDSLYWYIYHMNSKPDLSHPPGRKQLFNDGVYVDDIIVQKDHYYLFWYRN